MTYLRVVIPL